MYLGMLVSRIVAFLRAGYPKAMPATGHLALAALLRRRVSEDEIELIARDLIMRRRASSAADIGVEITRFTDEMPWLIDIKRVQRRIDTIHCARDPKR